MANRAIASVKRYAVIDYDNGYWSAQFAEDWQPFPAAYRHQRLAHMSEYGTMIGAIKRLVEDESWPKAVPPGCTVRVIRVELVHTNHARGAAKRAGVHVPTIFVEKRR